jgi:hypothetical protein
MCTEVDQKLKYLFDEYNESVMGHAIGKQFKEMLHRLGLETLIAYPADKHQEYLEQLILDIRTGFNS